MIVHPTRLIACISTLWLLATGCADTPTGNQLNPDNDSQAGPSTDQMQSEIFSIPSPVQAALLMSQAGVAFNPVLLNDPANRDKYINERRKALNLGVYGADLAYISNYKNPQLSQQYFEVIAKLADDLEILDKLDPPLLKRFKENMDSRDSLLVLNANFYRDGNRYLKKSERYEVAAMILIGGWVESMHLVCDAAMRNAAMRAKVGEQKAVVSNLVSILDRLPDSDAVAMREKLLGLEKAYARMTAHYEYVESIDDSVNKITYINSKSSVEVTDEQLNQVKILLEELRNQIIN